MKVRKKGLSLRMPFATISLAVVLGVVCSVFYVHGPRRYRNWVVLPLGVGTVGIVAARKRGGDASANKI